MFNGQGIKRAASWGLIGIGLLVILSIPLDRAWSLADGSVHWRDSSVSVPALTFKVSTPVYTQPPSPVSPSALRIPAIGIDSPVVAVDLIRGEIGTPCDPNYPYMHCNTNAVAWFDQSPLPGDRGTAILDSHELWYGAYPPLYVPAAFTHLHETKVGDQVIVTDEKGHAWTFMVDVISILAYPQVPANTYTSEGTPSVMLITCNGVYNPRIHGLQNRLFVHARWRQSGIPATLDAERPLTPFKQPWA